MNQNATDLQPTCIYRLGVRATRTLQNNIKKDTLWCARLTNALARMGARNARIARTSAFGTKLNFCHLCSALAHCAHLNFRRAIHLWRARTSCVACAWQLAHCAHLSLRHAIKLLSFEQRAWRSRIARTSTFRAQYIRGVRVAARALRAPQPSARNQTSVTCAARSRIARTSTFRAQYIRGVCVGSARTSTLGT